MGTGAVAGGGSGTVKARSDNPAAVGDGVSRTDGVRVAETMVFGVWGVDSGRHDAALYGSQDGCRYVGPMSEGFRMREYLATVETPLSRKLIGGEICFARAVNGGGMSAERRSQAV